MFDDEYPAVEKFYNNIACAVSELAIHNFMRSVRDLMENIEIPEDSTSEVTKDIIAEALEKVLGEQAMDSYDREQELLKYVEGFLDAIRMLRR